MSHSLIDKLCQFLMVFFSALAIYLMQQPNEQLIKYSSIVGLMGQPFWFRLCFKTKDFGLFVCSVMYTALYFYGFYNYWVVL